ncbi:MAG TPA: hypothetical protein VIL65_13665 [Beijerinckiaceae bacterium]|jgi:hypothetical protein
MMKMTLRLSRRTAALSVGSAALLLVSGGGHAEDDAGVRAFFQSQQPIARATPVAAPVQQMLPAVRVLPTPEAVARPFWGKPTRAVTTQPSRAPSVKQSPKIDYVSLPKELAVEKPTAPMGPRLPPLQVVMQDETLRPGDVVVFPDGPRVFNGRTERTHKASSFEPVGRSKLVASSARKVLATLPVASGPSRAAPPPSALAKALPLVPAKTTATNAGAPETQVAFGANDTRTTGATVRVIYPGLAAPMTALR